MLRIFSYLVWRSAVNRLVRQLRQLRNPRYLLAILLGGVYLYAVLLQRQPVSPATAVATAVVELVMTLLLAGAVAWAWVFGVERRALAFNPAEVTFLFPAPISRRDLIQYKLLRLQLLVLLNTILWTLLLSRGRFDGEVWRRAGSIWVVLTTLSLHRLGASFVRTSVAEHGRLGARHRVVSLAVLGLVVGALLWSVVDAVPAIRQAWGQGVQPWLQSLADAAARPLPHALLSPFRLLIAPFTAEGWQAWLRAIGPALGLMAAHYVWVLRSDTAFEEVAMAAALDRAKRRGGGPRRTGARARLARPPYRLAPLGWPGGAIIWKNVIAANRLRRIRHAAVILVAAAVVGGVLSFTPGSPVADIAGWLAITWAGALIVIGPQWIRNDLRGDLLNIDLLRSYPLRGRTVVIGEVAASAMVLTLFELALLLFASVVFVGNDTFIPARSDRAALLLAAACVLPGINFMGMLIQNGAALLYPTWSHLGTERASGIEALGQNLLTTVAFVILLTILLALPLAAGGGLYFALEPSVGGWALLPAALGFLAVIAGEAVPLVTWLGGVFERTDPATAGIITS